MMITAHGVPSQRAKNTYRYFRKMSDYKIDSIKWIFGAREQGASSCPYAATPLPV